MSARGFFTQKELDALAAAAEQGDAPVREQIAGPGIGDLARIAFDAYGASTGGKTWDGKDIPPFDVVRQRTPHVAKAWEDAVAAVLATLERAR